MDDVFVRPEQCPDAGAHGRRREAGDYRPMRRYQCPSCGFWCMDEASASVVHHAPSRVIRVPARFDVAVVGVSFEADYPANLQRIAGQAADGITWELVLVREPANPYDTNAVAVAVAADDSTLGHLPAGLAGRLGPAMDAGQRWAVVAWAVLVNPAPAHPDRPGLSLSLERSADLSQVPAILETAS